MKLSIITINYNNLEGLRKTIESVVNQTWQEFEWIIVDGGSTDGSRELIEETAAHLAAQDWRTDQFSLLGFTAEKWESGGYPVPSSREAHSRTLLWASEKDKGIYNAMNKGIVMAQGEYCLFLNSGDWLSKRSSLSDVSDFLASEGLVICDMYYNGHRMHDVRNKKLTLSYFRKHSLPHQSTFIQRKLFDRVKLYDEHYRIVSDKKWFIDAVVYNSVSYIYRPIDIAQFQGGGISIETPMHALERKSLEAKYFPERVSVDCVAAESFYEVNANRVMRVLYSVLYRLSNFI